MTTETALPKVNTRRYRVRPEVVKRRWQLTEAARRVKEAENRLDHIQGHQERAREDRARAEKESQRTGHPIVPHREILEYGTGSGKVPLYYEPLDETVVEEAKRELRNARRVLKRAQDAHDEVAGEEAIWDPVRACQQAGTRFVVNQTRLVLGEWEGFQGEPIPTEILVDLGPEKRRGLLRGRKIAEIL